MFVCQLKQQHNCQVCYKLSLQCNKTVDTCLWPETESAGMDWNLKNVRLMFFKVSHFCFQNVLEQITSCSFQELSWFLSSRHSRIVWQLIEGLISSFFNKRYQKSHGTSPLILFKGLFMGLFNRKRLFPIGLIIAVNFKLNKQNKNTTFMTFHKRTVYLNGYLQLQCPPRELS